MKLPRSSRTVKCLGANAASCRPRSLMTWARAPGCLSSWGGRVPGRRVICRWRDPRTSGPPLFCGIVGEACCCSAADDADADAEDAVCSRSTIFQSCLAAIQKWPSWVHRSFYFWESAWSAVTEMIGAVRRTWNTYLASVVLVEFNGFSLTVKHPLGFTGEYGAEGFVHNLGL